MILTPIPDGCLDATLARFAAALASDARAVFRRFARPDWAVRARARDCIKNDNDSFELASSFAMHLKPGTPGLDVSWDGESLRRETESYVLVHEVAHWQLAAPERRRLVDFGLGPGPETGDRERAARARRLFGLACEREEAMASLLGILWEAELGHPALASFLDQNWLEGALEPGRLPGAAAHFARILGDLKTEGFVDAAGSPRRRIRTTPDGPDPCAPGIRDAA